MSDTILGIPVHPLIVHATVVVVPSAALAVLLYAVWPRFRRWAGWGPLALALAAAVLTPLTTSSGESLEHTVGESRLVEEHAKMGDLLAAMLTDLLSGEGYDVDIAADGQRGLHLGLTREYDVVVLDRGLPAIDGLDVLARRRQQDSAPLLVFPGGTLDVPGRCARLDDGTQVGLSERETMLMAVLARHPRQVFTRTDLIGSVFEDAAEEGVVDTYVHYLRRKLGRSTVATVRGLGYRVGRT